MWICPNGCRFNPNGTIDTSSINASVKVVLNDAPLHARDVPENWRAFVESKDNWPKQSPNMCYKVSDFRVAQEGYLLPGTGFGIWERVDSAIVFPLRFKEDVGYAARITLTPKSVIGSGRSWGGVGAFKIVTDSTGARGIVEDTTRFPRDSIVGRRISGPDLSACFR